MKNRNDGREPSVTRLRRAAEVRAGRRASKAAGLLTAIILLMLSGCTAYDTGAAQPARTENAAAASTEVPPPSGSPAASAASTGMPLQPAVPTTPAGTEPTTESAAEAAGETVSVETTQLPPETVAAAEEPPAETTAAAKMTAGEKEDAAEPENAETEEEMKLLIGETEVPVTWEDNASVEALRALRPLTIRMSMYGGFEQVGPIGQSIVRDDRQTDTSFGDIVLYSGNQIVIFYGSNSWAYTRLGHVDLSQQEMSALIGGGDVSITLE